MNRIKNKILRRLLKITRYTLLCFGGFCVFMIIFPFTSGPFWIYHWLGTTNVDNVKQPEAIILLSGGGMPGEDGLFRTYYTARAAKEFPGIPIIIAMPGDTTDSYSSIMLTYQELLLRSIDTSRVFFENIGANTREQALEIASGYPSLLNDSVMIITSPVHMRRAVLAFEKVGFKHVVSLATFDRIIESDLSFEDENLGGSQLIPGLGNSINLRYRFWGHLKLEIDILRELIALGYYGIKGWI